MIKNVLTHIGGVENYGIISILLFFTVFAGTLVWAFGLNRRHLDAAARLPLEDGDAVPAPAKRNSTPHNIHE